MGNSGPLLLRSCSLHSFVLFTFSFTFALRFLRCSDYHTYRSTLLLRSVVASSLEFVLIRSVRWSFAFCVLRSFTYVLFYSLWFVPLWFTHRFVFFFSFWMPFRLDFAFRWSGFYSSSFRSIPVRLFVLRFFFVLRSFWFSLRLRRSFWFAILVLRFFAFCSERLRLRFAFFTVLLSLSLRWVYFFFFFLRLILRFRLRFVAFVFGLVVWILVHVLRSFLRLIHVLVWFARSVVLRSRFAFSFYLPTIRFAFVLVRFVCLYRLRSSFTVRSFAFCTFWFFVRFCVSGSSGLFPTGCVYVLFAFYYVRSFCVSIVLVVSWFGLRLRFVHTLTVFHRYSTTFCCLRSFVLRVSFSFAFYRFSLPSYRFTFLFWFWSFVHVFWFPLRFAFVLVLTFSFSFFVVRLFAFRLRSTIIRSTLFLRSFVRFTFTFSLVYVRSTRSTVRSTVFRSLSIFCRCVRFVRCSDSHVLFVCSGPDFCCRLRSLFDRSGLVVVCVCLRYVCISLVLSVTRCFRSSFPILRSFAFAFYDSLPFYGYRSVTVCLRSTYWSVQFTFGSRSRSVYVLSDRLRLRLRLDVLPFVLDLVAFVRSFWLFTFGSVLWLRSFCFFTFTFYTVRILFRLRSRFYGFWFVTLHFVCGLDSFCLRSPFLVFFYVLDRSGRLRTLLDCFAFDFVLRFLFLPVFSLFFYLVCVVPRFCVPTFCHTVRLRSGLRRLILRLRSLRSVPAFTFVRSFLRSCFTFSVVWSLISRFFVVVLVVYVWYVLIFFFFFFLRCSDSFCLDFVLYVVLFVLRSYRSLIRLRSLFCVTLDSFCVLRSFCSILRLRFAFRFCVVRRWLFVCVSFAFVRFVVCDWFWSSIVFLFYVFFFFRSGLLQFIHDLLYRLLRFVRSLPEFPIRFTILVGPTAILISTVPVRSLISGRSFVRCWCLRSPVCVLRSGCLRSFCFRWCVDLRLV